MYDAETYSYAVSQLRGAPGDTPFFEWLYSVPTNDWAFVFKRVSSNNNNGIDGVTQSDGRDKTFADLAANGIEVLGLWDVRCYVLALRVTDPAKLDYWRERWEMYRLNYIGGRWLADQKIKSVELYNEPDGNTGCLNATFWRDDVRIRSQAMQDAYVDQSAQSGVQLTPYIVGPTTTSAWREDYSPPIFELMKTPFPGNVVDPEFTLVNAYSYHKYGSLASSSTTCTRFASSCTPVQGNAQRSMLDTTLRPKIAATNYPDIDLVLSEYNCFTGAEADSSDAYFHGRNPADFPEVGACIAGQIGSLVKKAGGLSSLSLHRLTQSATGSGSGVAKTGLLYTSKTATPNYITDTTKSAEALRLIRRKAGSNARIWSFFSELNSIERSRVTLWAVDDDVVSVK